MSTKRIYNFFISDIATKSLVVLSIPVLAHIMGPDELGKFSEWFSFFSVISVVISLGIPSILLVLLRKSEWSIEDIDAYLSRVNFEWILFIAIILTLFSFFVSKNNFFLITLFLCSIFYFFIDYSSAKFRHFNKFRGYFFLQLMASLSVTVIPILFLLYIPKFEYRIVSILISYFIISLFLICFVTRPRIRVKLPDNFRSRIFVFGLPVVAVSAANWLRIGFDIQILKFLYSFNEVGVLGFCFQMLAIVTIVSASLNRAASVKFYEFLEYKDVTEWKLLLRKLMLIIIAISVCSIIFVFSVIYLFLPDYELSYWLFFPMVLGAIFYAYAQFKASILLYNENSSALFVATGLSSLMHPLFTILLSQYYGIKAIGISYLLSHLVFLMLINFQVKKQAVKMGLLL